MVDAMPLGGAAWHLKNEMGGFMESDKMREEFENSPKFRGMDFTRSAINPDYYESPYANGAWDGWQASRESLVIDLSDLSRCFSPNDCGDWAMWLDDVRIMVQAAGLKVKL